MKVPELKSVGPAAPASTAKLEKTAPVERVSTAQSQSLASTHTEVRAQLPAERAARVAHLAQTVKRGQLHPNAQLIAERILEEAELDARLRALLNK